MNTDKSIDHRARELFRQSCHNLPLTQRQALAQTRAAAVSGHRRQRTPRVMWLMPAGAAAALAALVIGWSPLGQRHDLASPATRQATVPALATADAPPDLYQNLDFYRWLAAHDSAAQARH